MTTFNLTGEYIELIKLLKAVRIAESGAHAKFLVEDSEVKLNGVVEYRKRAKVKVGDKVEALGKTIEVI
ncbi:putative protein YbcJ [anaerobic digester metagenome]|jgi:ribosome-associated protein|nr:RNA-binding S4 domain-containing protein [Tenuifilaceae bacterium]HQB77863.1 RNA-binding S4 domain-containing protein [Tenuifilaceae bacterium]